MSNLHVLDLFFFASVVYLAQPPCPSVTGYPVGLFLTLGEFFSRPRAQSVGKPKALVSLVLHTIFQCQEEMLVAQVLAKVSSALRAPGRMDTPSVKVYTVHSLAVVFRCAGFSQCTGRSLRSTMAYLT